MLWRPGLVAAVLVSALAACASRGARPIAPGAASGAGTYAVIVCRERCDPARPEQALARGHLVLEDEPYPLSALPQAVRSYLERYVSVLTAMDAGDAPNACFVLTRAAGGRTYAGITKVGVTRWLPDSVATLQVPLFHSPDAGYLATLTIRGNELRGSGESWGSGTGDPPFPNDSIVGRRVGPPDRGLCIRAMEGEAAAQRSAAPVPARSQPR